MSCPACGNLNRSTARFCDRCGAALAPAEGVEEPRATPEPLAIDAERADARVAPLPDDAPAIVGGGRFVLRGLLGEGSRKRVYLADDRTRDDRPVAIGLFEVEAMAASASARARREVQAMEQLGRHPHIVEIVASGQHEGRPYIASEHMPGGGLLELLAAAPDRRLTVERALELAIDVASGLEHAHSRGIIHRDIKPANIWLGADGSARLGDFGLARTGTRSREAVESMVVGTVAYLPPEQAIGRPTDARADLYSLGAVLYEMVSGEPPFGGDDPVSIISRHLSTEPVAPSRHNPAVPAALDGLIERLLAKSPEQRPADARSVREELEAIAASPDPEPAEREPENPLDRLAGGIFVGREAELGALTEALEGALAGRGGIALIEGEPGIGKSRLASELATYARVRGARVLTASCPEGEGTPAFWPFAQAIRDYARDADPVELAWQLGPDAAEVARLVPELRERLSSGQELPELVEEARFGFYEAVARFITGAAATRPILMVLDDLHWADPSSLELLRFCSGRVPSAPILLVGAYREQGSVGSSELAGTLAELTEAPRHLRLSLHGLPPEAIARYIELTAGQPAPPELVQRVHERTGGNPFFVGEVVRLIAGGGLEGDEVATAIPSGVRDAVARRLAALGPECRTMLETASVLGRELDVDLLADLADLASDPAGLDRALREAVASRILVPLEGQSGRYGFAHAVFVETLYELLDPQRRVDLHRRAAESLERRHAGRIDQHLAVIARHYSEAAAAGELERAIEYTERAGRQAAAQLAHAAAAEQLGRALELQASSADPDPGHELTLRLELGEEQTRAGRFDAARETLEGATALARRHSNPIAFAQAVLGIAALTEEGSKDAALVELIEEALEQLDDRQAGIRARLLAALAHEYYWEDVKGRARELANEAIATAGAAGDDGALAAALLASNFLWTVAEPGRLAEQLARAEELIEVAARAGDRNAEINGQAYRLTTLLRMGEIDPADRAIADFAALAERLGEPRHAWHVPMIGAMRAIMRGRFADARELSQEAARLGALAQQPLAAQYHAIQMALLQSFEGAVEEMLPVVRRMADQYPAIPAWRLALVSFLVLADRADEARVEFEPLAARGFDALPEDVSWLPGMVRIAEAAAVLADLDSCRLLYERLSDFAGEVVIIGRAVTCAGPVDRYLGLLTRALGAPDAAIAHLERAIAICERIGDRPWRADCRLQLGLALIDRDRSGDRERALEVLGAALDEGQRLGMRQTVERAIGARLEAQGVAAVDVNASIDSMASAASSEHPDLAAYAAADGRVTIMFSDIENSTLLTERLGDERWIELLREHNEVFRRRLGEHGGYEVKNQGDGFMLTFPDPDRALHCALAVQRDMEAHGSEREDPLRVRIGLHVGEAIEEEGDFFGRSVILAARIAAHARGGEVLVSEALRSASGEHHDYGEGRELELKGLAGTHRVYAVRWLTETEGMTASVA